MIFEFLMKQGAMIIPTVVSGGILMLQLIGFLVYPAIWKLIQSQDGYT